VVRHEETGLLVDRNEPELIRQAVGRLLEDELLARRLGEAGRRMVEQEFTLDKMVTATISAYEEAAGTA
jgi:glycosyltransferase involved in cell wall biosynthesis